MPKGATKPARWIATLQQSDFKGDIMSVEKEKQIKLSVDEARGAETHNRKWLVIGLVISVVLIGIVLIAVS